MRRNAVDVGGGPTGSVWGSEMKKPKPAKPKGVDPLKLLEAAETGDVALLRKLFDQGAKVDTAGPLGFTALMTAAEAGQLPVVRFLIAEGARLEPLNEEGTTALWLAAAAGHAKIVTALANAKADLEAVMNPGSPDGGSTALTTAAYHGREEAVRALLAAGADPKHAPGGKTAHSRAVEQGHRKVAAILEK
jgi:uncharacterized protein